MQPIIFRFQDVALSGPLRRGVAPFRSHILLCIAKNQQITGVTRDSAGAVLGGCGVELFRTASDIMMLRTVSDATTGDFRFSAPDEGPYYIVAYKAGAPDVAGTSVNTLTAA